MKRLTQIFQTLLGVVATILVTLMCNVVYPVEYGYVDVLSLTNDGKK